MAEFLEEGADESVIEDSSIQSAVGLTGLGRIPGTVRRLNPGNRRDQTSRLPHMGWSAIELNSSSPLLQGIASGSEFYYAHSYAFEPGIWTTADSEHGESFSAVLERNNCHGVQFHPEKSGEAGRQLLRNYLSICLQA